MSTYDVQEVQRHVQSERQAAAQRKADRARDRAFRLYIESPVFEAAMHEVIESGAHIELQNAALRMLKNCRSAEEVKNSMTFYRFLTRHHKTEA